MKKSIITFLCLVALAPVAMAARPDDARYQEPCQYTVLQNLIRDAKNHERIFDMIRAGVQMEDKTISCGGTLLQLAIRRGNPSILNGILTQNRSRIDSLVPMKDFPIQGVPDRIPVILFAAYYAPSEVVFNVMLEAGANVAVKDERGHGILWYLDQNPVLRKTKVEDSIQLALQNMLLKQAQQDRIIPPKQEPDKIDLSQDTLAVPETEANQSPDSK